MKQQYIKQVSKKLSVSSARKKEILRDLEEAFASAIEHGETEKQVIERLGTAEEFAASMSDQPVRGMKSRLMGTFVSATIAVMSFALFGIVKMQQSPQGAIGQADAMTNIRVAGSVSFNLPMIFLILGIFTLVIAAINTLWTVIRRRK